ncbi:MAG: adenosylcobinamide-GDP ribazoletransferase [Candidatus Omnitrophota bacterium]|nr:adenosylcobinamide-GDP ribazoletransferase [Candidatus Omnitrophota bacterium]
MTHFLIALQFLTIIPIGNKITIDKKKLSFITVSFPIIGLVLGLILSCANQLFSLVLSEPLLINVFLIVLLIILTGGLHLDGLADTFDALLSRKDRQEMLKIMRQSNIGTMGVLSLISVILIKLALLNSLDASLKNTSLILMCLLSRYSLVFSMFLFPYAREEGKAKAFIEGMNFKIFSLATILSLIFSLLIFKLKGLIIFGMVVIFVLLIGKFITKKIGGITGDTLGAVNELTEAFILLNVLILTGGCKWMMLQ